MQKLCSLPFTQCKHQVRSTPPPGRAPRWMRILPRQQRCSPRRRRGSHVLRGAAASPPAPQIITCDAQPSPSNGIIVLVSGNLLVRFLNPLS